MRLRFPGMRWTKAALLLFGFGAVLGFGVVVAGGLPLLERVAAAAMALGLLGLPLALFADGRGVAMQLSRRQRPRARGRQSRRPVRRPIPRRSRRQRR